jgi:hippurate hydrolase
LLQKKAGAYIFLGNGGTDGGCMLHNPRYDFNDDIIPVGVAFWAQLVRRFLAARA